MPKEQFTELSPEELKKHLGGKLVKAIGEYLDEGSDVSVSQAQIEAFERVKNALPEGRLRELASWLSGFQSVSSKFSEIVTGIQDTGWKVAKPLVVLEAPLVMAIPEKPFSKLAIKGAKLSGALGEKAIKAGVRQTEKVKTWVKSRKKSK